MSGNFTKAIEEWKTIVESTKALPSTLHTSLHSLSLLLHQMQDSHSQVNSTSLSADSLSRLLIMYTNEFAVKSAIVSDLEMDTLGDDAAALYASIWKLEPALDHDFINASVDLLLCTREHFSIGKD